MNVSMKTPPQQVYTDATISIANYRYWLNWAQLTF